MFLPWFVGLCVGRMQKFAKYFFKWMILEQETFDWIFCDDVLPNEAATLN